ncbi:MAG: M48 family metallopeptidase [Bacteroidota bacterium]
MKKFYAVLFVHLFAVAVFAQQQLDKNYDPISSKGAIPAEFINSVNAKWEQYQQQQIDKKEKRKNRKDKVDFLLSSSEQLDAVLKSGKVTFSNDVYQYLNKLTDKILDDNVKLINEVRVYPIDFETSNAFAFNEGALFVHVGLIARSESEAELAYILGHEIGHYEKKHSIQRHMEAKKAERNEGVYKRTDENEQLKAVRKYSRENEIDADKFGYKLLVASGYNAYAAVNALANLRRTLSPPLSTNFDIRLLEKGTLVIPKYYYENAEVASEKPTEKEEGKSTEEAAEEEDELSTHPSIDSRIDAFLSELRVNDTINKPYYLVSKTDFEYIRELCRFELCRIYLLENKIDMAFYHINTMQQRYPENEYLKRMMAIAVARIAEASANNSLKRRIKSEANCADELVTSNYMLRKMNKEEISLLAIRYAWWVKQTSPPSADIDRILKYTITNYTSNYARKLTDFAAKDSFSRKLVDSYYIIDTTSLVVGNNKKSKINKTKSNTLRYWFDRSMSRFALSDIKDDAEFVKLFNTIASENPDRKKSISEDENTDNKSEKDNSVVISKSKEKVKSLNINSMILIEPEYYRVDNRKKKKTDAISNEVKEYKIRNMLLQTAEKAGFKLTLLAGNNFDENDVQRFTDYGLLKDWMNEFFIDKKRTAIPVDYTRINEIIKRYDSRYAALMVNVASVSNDNFSTKLLTLIVSVMYFPLLPFALYNMLPDKEFTMVFAVVDLEESKIVYGNIINFDTEDKSDLLKSQLYGIFTTLKGKKKAKKGENV